MGLNIFLIAFFLLTGPSAAEAASKGKFVKEGNALYKEGDYASSAEKYRQALGKDPESDVINFNLGTVLYKKEDFQKTIEHLQKVLLSDDEDLKEKTHYNLGNTYYKFGMAREEDDIAQAVTSLEKALKQYESALAIVHDDKDAEYNYEFVKKELERLKEKQQQQQQQDEQSQQKQDQEQQQDQQSQAKEQKNGQQQEEEGQQQQDAQQEPEGEQAQGEQSQKQDQQQGPARADAGQEGEDGGRQDAREPAPSDAQELTKQEAEMLLENYQQTEEPQGLLNVHRKSMDASAVLKDW